MQCRCQFIFRLLALALLLAGRPASATDVRFSYGDLQNTPQAVRGFDLYPIIIQTTNGQFITTKDRIRMTTDTNGTCIATNLLPGRYRGQFNGSYTVTTNFFTFPTGLTNGQVNAKDYVDLSPFNIAGLQYAGLDRFGNTWIYDGLNWSNTVHGGNLFAASFYDALGQSWFNFNGGTIANQPAN